MAIWAVLVRSPRQHPWHYSLHETLGYLPALPSRPDNSSLQLPGSMSWTCIWTEHFLHADMRPYQWLEACFKWNYLTVVQQNDFNKNYCTEALTDEATFYVWNISGQKWCSSTNSVVFFSSSFCSMGCLYCHFLFVSDWLAGCFHGCVLHLRIDTRIYSMEVQVIKLYHQMPSSVPVCVYKDFLCFKASGKCQLADGNF